MYDCLSNTDTLLISTRQITNETFAIVHYSTLFFRTINGSPDTFRLHVPELCTIDQVLIYRKVSIQRRLLRKEAYKLLGFNRIFSQTNTIYKYFTLCLVQYPTHDVHSG